MKSVIKKQYTAEFKAQTVELVKLGKPVSEVAQAPTRNCQPQTRE